MRVAIDTTYGRRAPQSGTGVYLEQLCAALREEGADVVEIANPRRRPPAGGGLGSLRNAAADLRWTAVDLPRRAARAGADVIHHPLPALAPLSAIPQVLTLHDLAFERLPDAFDPAFRRYAHLVHRAAARRADTIVAVSHTTAGDAAELWDVSQERIVVAHHGPGQPLPPVSAPGTRGHFLYVGDAEPRKDLGTLLAAHARYRAGGGTLDLVLAGSVDATAPGVRVEPAPEPQRLAALYGGAAALVHPARYEGFGMTPLEAMSLGTPVVAARAPGVVEVCGEAAVYFPPGEAAALAQRLRDVETAPPDAAALRRHAGGFSWRGSARRHLDAYSLAVGARRGRHLAR
jgi:glycosyltransferase involved in cell wall biosynthesis